MTNELEEMKRLAKVQQQYIDSINEVAKSREASFKAREEDLKPLSRVIEKPLEKVEKAIQQIGDSEEPDYNTLTADNSGSANNVFEYAHKVLANYFSNQAGNKVLKIFTYEGIDQIWNESTNLWSNARMTQQHTAIINMDFYNSTGPLNECIYAILGPNPVVSERIITRLQTDSKYSLARLTKPNIDFKHIFVGVAASYYHHGRGSVSNVAAFDKQANEDYDEYVNIRQRYIDAMEEPQQQQEFQTPRGGEERSLLDDLVTGDGLGDVDYRKNKLHVKARSINAGNTNEALKREVQEEADYLLTNKAMSRNEYSKIMELIN